METRNSWDWESVEKTDYWMTPSAEGHFYMHKWRMENRRRVLDIGCGMGRHSILFAENGFHVTAMDTSGYAVSQLRDLADERGLDMRCDVADMVDLPYDDGSFDCVFAYLSVSHTDSTGFGRILSGIRRVLVPGGAVFMTLCSKDTWSFRDAGYPRLDDNTVVKTDGPEKGIPHYYVDKEDIGTLFSDFELVSVRCIDDCYFQNRWQKSIHFHVEALKPC